jgi:hypothetical protein
MTAIISASRSLFSCTIITRSPRASTSGCRKYLIGNLRVAVLTTIKWRPCEGYSGLVPRRYCKKTLLRVQRLVESRGLWYGCFINNGTPSGSYSLILVARQICHRMGTGEWYPRLGSSGREKDSPKYKHRKAQMGFRSYQCHTVS